MLSSDLWFVVTVHYLLSETLRLSKGPLITGFTGFMLTPVYCILHSVFLFIQL